jgi:hypothetical protein
VTEKAPLGRILRNFRLHTRAPFQGNPFGSRDIRSRFEDVISGQKAPLGRILCVRKNRGNRLRMHTRSLPWRHLRSRDWRHFRSGPHAVTWLPMTSLPVVPSSSTFRNVTWTVLIYYWDISYFTKKKKKLILPKNSLILIINMLEFLLIFLLCLVHVFFNRQSAYMWAQTVLLFSPTYFFICIRQDSHSGFSRKTKRS